ncbi:collagen-like protein, partial [candidate division KSB1 bacterium]|nr:collagen-like protein [candidate division KSB1 bacterium]
GATGATGLRGATGATGLTGPTGATGATGPLVHYWMNVSGSGVNTTDIIRRAGTVQVGTGTNAFLQISYSSTTGDGTIYSRNTTGIQDLILRGKEVIIQLE